MIVNCFESVFVAKFIHFKIFKDLFVLGGHNGYRFFTTLYRLNLKTLEWNYIVSKGNFNTERACFSWKVINDQGLSILIGGFGPKPKAFDEYPNPTDDQFELLWIRYKDIATVQLPTQE